MKRSESFGLMGRTAVALLSVVVLSGCTTSHSRPSMAALFSNEDADSEPAFAARPPSSALSEIERLPSSNQVGFPGAASNFTSGGPLPLPSQTSYAHLISNPDRGRYSPSQRLPIRRVGASSGSC